MRITARVDYAVRAALELAAAAPGALTCDKIATAQDIPSRFLQSILGDLQHARLVTSQRGREGGYRLALPNGPDGVYSAVRQRSAQAGLRVIHLDQYSGKVLMDLGPQDVGAVARLTDWGISVHQGL